MDFRKKLDAYLKQYKNPKFQTFARNTIDGKVIRKSNP